MKMSPSNMNAQISRAISLAENIDIVGEFAMKYYVDGVTGNDDNQGTIDKPFKTIRRAVHYAENKARGLNTGAYRDVILEVTPGTYDEHVSIYYNGIERFVIRPPGNEADTVTAKIKIKGMHMQYGGRIVLQNVEVLPSPSMGYSLEVYHSKNLTLHSCIIHGSVNGRSGLLAHETNVRSHGTQYINASVGVGVEGAIYGANGDNFSAVSSNVSGLGAIIDYNKDTAKPPTTLGAGIVSGKVMGGIVIEKDTNANGSWQRFQDGTMICTTARGASMNTHQYQSYQLPVAFVDSFAASVSFGGAADNQTPGGQELNNLFWDNAHFGTVHRIDGDLSKVGYLYRGPIYNVAHTVFITCIGRWK